jgi:Ca-activated chloride channel homolog
MPSGPKDPAKDGHPRSGQFKPGRTNPDFSTGGPNPVTGTTSDPTAGDVADAETRGFAQGAEQPIVHCGDISMTFPGKAAGGAACDFSRADTIDQVFTGVPSNF